MPDLGKIGLKPVGPLARLAGFKWIERDDTHGVLRVPRWLPRSVLDAALKKVWDDYRLLYPGGEMRRGRRLVRFDLGRDS